jgi:hypothetical protein
VVSITTLKTAWLIKVIVYDLAILNHFSILDGSEVNFSSEVAAEEQVLVASGKCMEHSIRRED